MSQLISSLIQRPVCSVSMEDTVSHVEALLAAKRLSWVPVLEPENHEVVGVISASDVAAFHAQGGDAAATRAWQMCSYKPVAVDAERTVTETALLMVQRGIHHVVVTDRNGLAGVVSALDLLRWFAVASKQLAAPRPD